MKLILKIFLVICLFSSAALADDGDMPTGGKTCPSGQTCFAGDMPTGGRAAIDHDDSVLTLIQKYIISIFE